MKNKEKLIIVKQNDGCALIKICVFEACVYAIYVQKGEDIAMEIVGKNEERAEELFEQIVKGELSPIHLGDYIADKALETEIFR